MGSRKFQLFSVRRRTYSACNRSEFSGKSKAQRCLEHFGVHLTISNDCMLSDQKRPFLQHGMSWSQIKNLNHGVWFSRFYTIRSVGLLSSSLWLGATISSRSDRSPFPLWVPFLFESIIMNISPSTATLILEGLARSLAQKLLDAGNTAHLR